MHKVSKGCLEDKNNSFTVCTILSAPNLCKRTWEEREGNEWSSVGIGSQPPTGAAASLRVWEGGCGYGGKGDALRR